MKITIKNLQKQTFCIHFDEAKTVKDLKEAIYVDRGSEYAVDRQKLIYAGIILEDERSLQSYDVSEKKFIVVMLKRAVVTAPSDKTITTKPTSQTKETVDVKETQGLQQQNHAMNTTAGSTTTTTTLTNIDVSTSLVMGEEYQRSVSSMVEMGYSRELVERAMSASFNNPERAVEYLISGIPESYDLGFVGGEEGAESLTPSSALDTTPTIPASHTADAENVSDPFEFLRNQPQFLQMRSLVYENPDLLQAVLRQIGNTNPALLQLISDNQDAFLNMLNQPIHDNAISNAAGASVSVEVEPATANRRAQLEAVTRAINGSSSGGRLYNEGTDTNTIGTRTAESSAPQSMTLNLTTNDKQAIERLKAMGFSEALVLQAYFACEKDEQLTANLLVSSAFDD